MDPPEFLDPGTVVSVGPSASLNINSGPISGSILVGDGSKVTLAGGGNGQVTSTLDVSGSVASGSDLLQNLQRPATVNTVSATLAVQAFSDAATLSADAAALTPTMTFCTLSGTTTITGNGALNVINVTTVNAPTLTITGGQTISSCSMSGRAALTPTTQ